MYHAGINADNAKPAGVEGDEVRSEDDDRKKAEKPGDGKKKQQDRNVGDALRAVYREAVAEDVPDEMLDLLKKLD